jgi:hypothetical protein
MEIAMKAAAVLISLTVVLTSSLSFAQGTDHSSGVAPEGRGSTGWTGGAREPDKTGQAETTGSNPQREGEAAADQPLMATGEDLNGPPVRLPPNKTPE